jgi:hypothetical protein
VKQQFTLRYNNSLIASGRILILVALVDTIPLEQRQAFKTSVINQFTLGGIAENMILFIEKNCEWDQSYLRQHDEDVSNFWREVPPTEDYYEALRKRHRSPSWLRYDRSECTKKGCSHDFTEDTRQQLHKYLSAMINDSNAANLSDKL